MYESISKLIAHIHKWLKESMIQFAIKSQLYKMVIHVLTVRNRFVGQTTSRDIFHVLPHLVFEIFVLV